MGLHGKAILCTCRMLLVPCYLLVCVLGIVGIFIGSATEPAIPALMKPLLDSGFDRGTLELWKIPAVLLLLFGVRGFAGFIAAYCLARVTNYSMERLRQKLFVIQ